MLSPNEVFREILNRDVKVVSTIDHPFPSPPVHLFDGHLQLYRKFSDSVLILNWDVSDPNDRFYRYDLTTDTGLIAKNKMLYHYDIEVPYTQQIFNPKPFSFLPFCAEVATESLKNRIGLPIPTCEKIVQQAHTVIEESQKLYNPEHAPWQYTKELLKMFYRKFQHEQLFNLIDHQYYNYYLSPIMTKWIPWCLMNVSGEMSIGELQKAGVFIRRPFRPAINSTSIQDYDIENLDFLSNEVASGKITPSLDVFLWSLAVANISHYGNDFDFFSRLATITQNPSFASLQVTKDGEDAKRFLKFDKDYGIMLDISPDYNVTASKKITAQVKLTRTNTFSAIFVALGEKMTDVLHKYADGEFNDGLISFKTGFSLKDSPKI